MTTVEASLALAFRQEGLRQRRCQSCGYVGPHLEVDHALPQQTLKRLFRQLGLAVPAAARWDVRNARLLCCEPAPNRCHGRWTNRCFGYAPPPIRACVRELAAELDRRYAVDGAEPFSAWVDTTYGRAVAA